jgi:hypothetical protein
VQAAIASGILRDPIEAQSTVSKEIAPPAAVAHNAVATSAAIAAVRAVAAALEVTVAVAAEVLEEEAVVFVVAVAGAERPCRDGKPHTIAIIDVLDCAENLSPR